MWMALVFSLVAGMSPAVIEDGDFLSVTARRGDTPLGFYYGTPVCREIPRVEWLATFAELNGVPNADWAFRRLPANVVWRLPIKKIEIPVPVATEVLPEVPVEPSPLAVLPEESATASTISAVEPPVVVLSEQAVEELTDTLVEEIKTVVSVTAPVKVDQANTTLPWVMAGSFLILSICLAVLLRKSGDLTDDALKMADQYRQASSAVPVGIIDEAELNEHLELELKRLQKLESLLKETSDRLEQVAYPFKIDDLGLSCRGQEVVYLKYAGMSEATKKVSERRVYLERTDGSQLITSVAKVAKHFQNDSAAFGLSRLAPAPASTSTMAAAAV